MKRTLRVGLDALLSRYRYRVVSENLLYEWQTAPQQEASFNKSHLPDGAENYLTRKNPVFTDLKSRYAAFDDSVTRSSQWTDDYVSDDDVLYFRGDNAYVWQLRGKNMNEMAYALSYYYVKSMDSRGLLATLDEDRQFGNHTFSIDDREVSRDLLDSIIELYFLDRYLQIFDKPKLTVLDIGAGYGRLAHRASKSIPGLTEYLCTDAYPVSTLVSEYYLRFRGVDDKARVIALDEIEAVLDDRHIDLAVNIHSFSECTLDAIEWWIGRLAKAQVRHLMIVPNTLDTLRAWDGAEYAEVLQRHRYALKAREPKYADPVVQRYGVNPAFLYLFELQSA